MTAKMSRQLDAIQFGIERVRALGVPGDELCIPEVLNGFGCCLGVLMVHRIPGQNPIWTVAPQHVPVHEALSKLLAVKGDKP